MSAIIKNCVGRKKKFEFWLAHIIGIIEVQWVYTNKGMWLAERMSDRLYDVGAAHFSDDESWIEISGSTYMAD